MDHRKHPLVEVVLGRHDDAPAVEQQAVGRAPGGAEHRILLLLQAKAGLGVRGRCGTDLIQEAEGRAREGMERGVIVGARVAVAAGERRAPR